MKDFKKLSSANRYKGDNEPTNSNKSAHGGLQGKLNANRASYRWEQLSKAIRKRWLLCQNPMGCEKKSTSVHHIRGAYHNPELFFLETNLIPFCEQCHRRFDNSPDQVGALAEYWKLQIEEFRK